jgi:hypothetical protein
MPLLPINCHVELSDEEVEAVADTLGCDPNDLAAALSQYAPAAVREYAEMFAGQAMATVTDARERRLLAILLALPAANFPSDDTIARLFNLTGDGGRALLRKTASRHRNRLKGVMEAAARRFLQACQQQAQGGDWEARFPNAIVIEMLNGQLASANQPRAPIRRKVGTFDTYVVSPGAKNELDALYP